MSKVVTSLVGSAPPMGSARGGQETHRSLESGSLVSREFVIPSYGVIEAGFQTVEAKRKRGTSWALLYLNVGVFGRSHIANVALRA